MDIAKLPQVQSLGGIFRQANTAAAWALDAFVATIHQRLIVLEGAAAERMEPNDNFASALEAHAKTRHVPAQFRDGAELVVERAAHALHDIGRYFHDRGWSVGTSSNYSVVLGRDPLRLFITASGKDKGRLGEGDFVLVDDAGHSLVRGDAKPSAETLIHVVLAQMPTVGAILHTHSVWSTILSDLYFPDGGLRIEGYEMLKGLAGVTTHEHSQWVEIFENTQDIAAFAVELRSRIDEHDRPLKHGFLLRRHGLYTWGRDLEEARRHIEIFEFLFEVIGRRLSLQPALQRA